MSKAAFGPFFLLAGCEILAFPGDSMSECETQVEIVDGHTEWSGFCGAHPVTVSADPGTRGGLRLAFDTGARQAEKYDEECDENGLCLFDLYFFPVCVDESGTYQSDLRYSVLDSPLAVTFPVDQPLPYEWVDVWVTDPESPYNCFQRLLRTEYVSPTDAAQDTGGDTANP